MAKRCKNVFLPVIQTLMGEIQLVFEYFPGTDMLYIKLAEGISGTEEIAPGVVLDFDEHLRIIGVEIEDASKFIDLSRLELKSFPLVKSIVSDRVSAAA